MTAEQKKKGWRSFLAALAAPFAAIKRATEDPITKASRLPEIQAAARSWRVRLETASMEPHPQGEPRVRINERLSTEELDAFQAWFAHELGTAKYYCPDFELWYPKGSEVALYLSFAARQAGISRKIDTYGWLTRMRITPQTVDHEVGTFGDYGKGNWEKVWTAPLAA